MQPTKIVSLFTREWIEIFFTSSFFSERHCLPLYEGVDWNAQFPFCKTVLFVSLFTREWIEIAKLQALTNHNSVSLFTREWIEIDSKRSPVSAYRVSLFTREWIEMSRPRIFLTLVRSLPLYEGVDWNFLNCSTNGRTCRLPLYEGVDWNRQNTVHF